MFAALLEDATKVDNVASVFSLFKTALPEQEIAHVDSLMTELLAIGGVLRELNTTIYHPNFQRFYADIADDLTIVRTHLIWSLTKIMRMFGKTGNGPVVAPIATYAARKTWHEIHVHFAQSGQTLLARLKLYTTFLHQLYSVARGTRPSPKSTLQLRQNILALDSSPELTDRLRNMNLNPDSRNISQSRSYERNRPQTDSMSTASPTDSIPPLSPTSTTSSRLGEAAINGYDHWAKRVFEGASSTAFARSNARTECYDQGRYEMPLKLYQNYEFLFDLKFRSDREITIGFYVRAKDLRARLLFETRKRGTTRYSCRSLDALEFRRSDNVLHILTRETGTLQKWAQIKFKSIERLVVVHSTLVAMRSYDTFVPISKIPDFELNGEEEVFGATIEDDGFQHALRMYLDKKTKAVRLVASVFRGELKNTPIWTAFVHFSLAAIGWLIPPTTGHPKRVLLCNLNRHITSPDYTPVVDKAGRHVLDFSKATDAEDFVRSIRDMVLYCSSRR